MKTCGHCKSQITDEARFCHTCGEKVLSVPIVCPECEALNTGLKKQCLACGFSFLKSTSRLARYKAIFPLNFQETSSLARDIKYFFFKEFRKRIEEEHDESKYEDYLKTFNLFDSDGKLELRANQLAEDVYSIHQKQEGLTQKKIDQHLLKNFNNFLDYFIILECKELNEIKFPQAILRYAEAKRNNLNVKEMILDYLDFKNESETYYTDFIVMPLKKLKNASSSFLFPNKDEKIIFIADQTIFGSCKEGYAMTEKGLYWKAHFNPAQFVFYKDLKSIKRENDSLIIDGNYFNVNLPINLKMMKLLKKLSEIF